jgi:hypothetical protein
MGSKKPYRSLKFHAVKEQKTFWRNAVGQIGDVLTYNRNVSENFSTILKVLLLAVRDEYQGFFCHIYSCKCKCYPMYYNLLGRNLLTVKQLTLIVKNT